MREGRWTEGRPLLSEFPRLWGQTLGLVAFGHVARAVAVRARAFGLHLIAYDPYVEELVLTQHGVEPVGLTELLQRADIFTHDARAWALAAAGRFDEAHASMTRALAENTQDARLFLHAGLISASAGRPPPG